MSGVGLCTAKNLQAGASAASERLPCVGMRLMAAWPRGAGGAAVLPCPGEGEGGAFAFYFGEYDVSCGDGAACEVTQRDWYGGERTPKGQVGRQGQARGEPEGRLGWSQGQARGGPQGSAPGAPGEESGTRRGMPGLGCAGPRGRAPRGSAGPGLTGGGAPPPRASLLPSLRPPRARCPPQPPPAPLPPVALGPAARPRPGSASLRPGRGGLLGGVAAPVGPVGAAGRRAEGGAGGTAGPLPVSAYPAPRQPSSPGASRGSPRPRPPHQSRSETRGSRFDLKI